MVPYLSNEEEEEGEKKPGMSRFIKIIIGETPILNSSFQVFHHYYSRSSQQFQIQFPRVSFTPTKS